MDEDLDRILELLKEEPMPDRPFYKGFEDFPDFRYRQPLFTMLKPIDPATSDIFAHKIAEIKIEPIHEGFQVMPGFLYHGTSLAAMDMILETGMMYPATYLLHEGKLVSGELKETMDRENDTRHNGPKFLSRKVMIEMGMLAADDPHLYEFGHAGDVVFGHHPLTAVNYVPEDRKQAAIIGVDSKVLTFYGAKLIDARSEGVLHEGPLSVSLALRQLLVPDDRVEEYVERTKDSYLVNVFPLSAFGSNAVDSKAPTPNSE